MKLLLPVLIVSILIIRTYGQGNPNKALFDYVTIQILKYESTYLTMAPRNLSHQFNVSFVFPNLKWNNQYADADSDAFHCLKDRLRRKLRNKYYKDNLEYSDALIIQFRNESKYDSYITADFSLHFIKSLPWPAWNKTAVNTLFPEALKGVSVLYPYPEINKSRDPFVNYTRYEIEWFDIIKDEINMFGESQAFAYFGYYNVIPPPPSYNGPEYESVTNVILYILLGFNIFVVALALFFWAVNCNRDKLLLAYWIKEDTTEGQQKEKAPGDM